MTPEIVVFDLGKVLVDFDYTIAVTRIAARCTVPLYEVKHFLETSPLLYRFESGLMTNDEFFDEVCATTGFCGTFDEFACLFSDIFTSIEPMVDIHARLRVRKIPTYILSNTNGLAVNHIRKTFPFFSNFDGYVYSYEHGAMKPDPKLYQVLERLSDRSGDQILYIDDRLENTEAGKALGWQAIHHQSPDETLAAIEKTGLL